MYLILNMDNKLIFDLGYFNGNSTKSFLQNDYTVIAVECNPECIDKCNILYKNYIENGNLILINKAVSDKDTELIPFYISNNSVWSSCLEKVANRCNALKTKINVDSITLKTLIDTYGCPYFCKIDLEGYDILALNSLKDTNKLPKYIQVESECVGDNEYNIDYLENLNTLHKLGYTKFNIQNGSNNMQIEPSNLEYYDYETIKSKLINTRKNHDFRYAWTFWYDIIATY